MNADQRTWAVVGGIRFDCPPFCSALVDNMLVINGEVITPALYTITPWSARKIKIWKRLQHKPWKIYYGIIELLGYKMPTFGRMAIVNCTIIGAKSETPTDNQA